MNDGPAPKRRGRILGFVKLALAAGLLAWVGISLPWRDSLLWIDGERQVELAGRILGDWRAESVRFHLDPGASLAADAPEELAAALAEGATLAVARRPAPVAGEASPPGYEWRPSMPRVFLEMEPRGLVLAFAALAAAALFGVTRWWRILRLASCPSTWPNTLRLTWLGMFFNLVVPGMTGGDVVKAVLVVREHPERRADALLSVVIDRMLGLWVLIALATAVVWSAGGAFGPLRIPVLLTLAGASALVVVALSRRARRAVRVDALIERLPQARRLKKLDRAAALYAGRPLELLATLALSLGNHVFVIAAVFAIGRAFGDALGPASYVGIVSTANVLSALPLTPGGWGVGEKAFGTLFELAGSEFALGVAVSVTYRLCNMGLGLFGGAFLLLPGAARMRSEVSAAGSAFDD